MTAGTYDIEIEIGVTFQLNIVWKDPDGNPIDNTGYDARMQVRHKYTSETALLEFTTTNSRITLGGTDGRISVKGAAILSDPITEKYGVYDLEMIAPNGDVYRVLQGVVTFSPQVTRS